MIKLYFVALLFTTCTATFAQTTEYKGTANLGPLAKVYKIVTLPCSENYSAPAGASTTIKHETKYTNGKTEITISSEVPADGTITIPTTKKIRIPLSPNSEGAANLYIDEGDKSTVKVNYYLNNTNTVKKGTEILEYYPEWDCNGNVTVKEKTQRKLAADEEFLMQKVHPDGSIENTTWFKNSNGLKVFKVDGKTLDYYLVNRYDRNATYVLELSNREYISYNSTDVDFGALTIPFKYRFGFNKNDIKIKDDISANFNIGVYAGMRLTNFKLINKKGTLTNSSPLALRVGPFLNLSAVALDVDNTTVGENPYSENEKSNIAVLSTGLGLMLDFKGLQLGTYGGWDFGMGSEADNWNYDQRFWLGFGIGYKITDLFSKKE